MANTEDYNVKLDVLKAIPLEKVSIPAIPMDVYLQEAENLYHWALDDQEKLSVVGISAEKLADLPIRAGACREAQSVWFKERFSQQEAQRNWGIQSPLAYDLRDELLHTFRYAYRKDESILGRVSAIAEGDGHADMIQDLNDLAVLGRENPDPLNNIGYDLAKLEQAGNTADQMADLLAMANGDKADQSESKIIRDKAFTHLKELVDEIREAGKYVFWRDPQRYKGYVSQYWKKKNSQKSEQPDEVVE